MARASTHLASPLFVAQDLPLCQWLRSSTTTYGAEIAGRRVVQVIIPQPRLRANSFVAEFPGQLFRLERKFFAIFTPAERTVQLKRRR